MVRILKLLKRHIKRQRPWIQDDHAVLEHLDLNITGHSVITMANRIGQRFTHPLDRVFPIAVMFCLACNDNSTSYIPLDECERVLDLLLYVPARIVRVNDNRAFRLECTGMDDGLRKTLLRILRKKEVCRTSNLILGLHQPQLDESTPWIVLWRKGSAVLRIRLVHIPSHSFHA